MSIRDLFHKIKGGKVPIIGEKPKAVPIMTLSFVNGHILINPAGPNTTLDVLRTVAVGAVAEIDRQIMVNIVTGAIEKAMGAVANRNGGDSVKEPEGGTA